MTAKVWIDGIEYLVNIKDVQVGGTGFQLFNTYLEGKCKERYVKGIKEFHMTLSMEILEKIILQAQKKYPESSQWMNKKQRLKKESKKMKSLSVLLKETLKKNEN